MQKLTLHNVHLSTVEEGCSKYDFYLKEANVVDRYPIDFPRQSIGDEHSFITVVDNS